MQRRQLLVVSAGQDARLRAILKHGYQHRPVAFIEDWVFTYDPRRTDGWTKLPFLLFPRQVRFVDFLLQCLDAQTAGLVEKSRDMGATWLCCALSIWMWLFRPGSSVGWGSRKEQLVDRIGDPDSIFEKMRMILRDLPDFLLPEGFSPQMHVAHMRIVNPKLGNTITGEAGDNIGRGGRKTVYFKDESAHYERPEMIEAALGDNTRVPIDISSVHGIGNVFHRKREGGVDWDGEHVVPGRVNVFVFDWRDHPLKDQRWYDQRRRDAEMNGLMHILAQEVDRDYSASLEGVVIPANWVASAIDAHARLGVDDSGGWLAALDVADEGGDTNALCVRKGIVVKSVTEWGGMDTGQTTMRAVREVTSHGSMDVNYDCVGVGAGVKGESNRLVRENLMPRELRFVPWNGGDEVQDKERHFVPGDKNSPLNQDLFANLKAQAWWCARRRFEITHRAVRSKMADATPDEKNFTWRADDIISLPSTLPLLHRLRSELSQATVSMGSRMKLVVDKKPDGAKSPNLADALVMCFHPMRALMRVTGAMLAEAKKPHVGLMGVRRPPDNVRR